MKRLFAVVCAALTSTVTCAEECVLNAPLTEILRSHAETNGQVNACAVVYRVADGCQIAAVGLGGVSVGYPYEPGSVVKPLVAMTAFDRGLALADTLVSTDAHDPKYENLPSDGTHVWPKELSVGDALTKSANVVFGKLGADIGVAALRESYSKFGIGSNGGSLLSRVVERDASRMAVGQLFCSTPDEIARAYVVLANYGKSPWSGEQIVSTNAVKAYLPALVSVASPKGTARRAAVDGVKVAGKTGTAQRKMDGRYMPGMYNATFVGFFPADDPKYVIVVLYQNADKNDRFHQGGQRPAQAFADIVRFLIGKNVDSKTVDYAVNDRVMRQRLEDMGLKELAKKIDKVRMEELTRLVAELRDDQQRYAIGEDGTLTVFHRGQGREQEVEVGLSPNVIYNRQWRKLVAPVYRGVLSKSHLCELLWHPPKIGRWVVRKDDDSEWNDETVVVLEVLVPWDLSRLDFKLAYLSMATEAGLQHSRWTDDD